MSKLREPFNPKTGEFRDNIRLPDGDDDMTELRESMKRFGWRKEFPAYKDERGGVLVGHRRLKVAAELKIKPVIVQLELGDGDEADAERLKIAIASNVGGKPMTKADRQRIAKYLYGERDWTMERIAEALDVSQRTISEDLRNLEVASKSKHAKSATNPKGAGRPKASASSKAEKRASGPKRRTEAAKAELAAALVLDKSYTLEQAAAEAGLASVQVVKTSVAQEQGRREVKPPPEVALAMSAQERFDAAMRAAKRKLEIDFEMRVLAECKRRLDEISLPHYAKELTELERSIRSRKGVMDRITYRKILACLHPDRVQEPALKKRYEEAFRLFTELEKRVLDETESPTQFRPMPRTYEELMKMKAKVAAERRAKRTDAKSAVAHR